MPQYRVTEEVSGARVEVEIDATKKGFPRVRGAVPVFLDVARTLARRAPLRELRVDAYDVSIFMNASFGGGRHPARIYIGWEEWEGYGLSSPREIAETLAFLSEVGDEEFSRAALGAAVGALGGVLDEWRLDGRAVSASGRVGGSFLEMESSKGPGGVWRIVLRWDQPGLGVVSSLTYASAVAMLNRPGALRIFAEGHRFLREVLEAVLGEAGPGREVVLFQMGFSMYLSLPTLLVPLGDVREMGDPRAEARRILEFLGGPSSSAWP